MGFLTKKGMYIKVNVSAQLRRDAQGFLTHLHPKSMWRVDLQKKKVEALKANMSLEERETVKAADGKENREMFITLNFRMQYVESKKGLLQTETLEVQAAPESKEMVNSTIFKTAKNGMLPGKYVPYGISQSIGTEEYRKILMRQNAFLAPTKIIGIQDLTEEIRESTVEYRDENGM